MNFYNPLPGVPLIENPFFDKIVANSYFDDELKRIANDLRHDGFAVFDFPDEQILDKADRIKAALHDSYDWEGWKAHGFASGEGLRIQDAWAINDDVRSIAVNASILGILQKLYGRRAIPFQTLNFPVGTQQHYHSDSVHFSSLPERFMCGVWLALEDIDDDNGPLVYFPGSHQWPIFTNEHIGKLIKDGDKFSQEAYEDLWQKLVEMHGAKPQKFHAKKGQALIWLANLLHGGDKHKVVDRTRWSQVTHYFFEDCAYYTPMGSVPLTGPFRLREIHDISTGKTIENKILGNTIRLEDFGVKRPKMLTREEFDAARYLAANPDVAASGAEAYEHYRSYGFKEGRSFAAVEKIGQRQGNWFDLFMSLLRGRVARG